jgi:hypothetical protein
MFRDQSMTPIAPPDVTFCVLTFGNYSRLIRRTLESIRQHCPRPAYRLMVGANGVVPETLKYLRSLQAEGEIDEIVLSDTNLSKCPMMRRMVAGVTNEFIWWFDDDSYFTDSTAFDRWMTAARAAPPATVMWGQAGCCSFPSDFTDLDDLTSFVRSAPWYRGLTPPCWRPGGKGEMNFQGRGTGDGRWYFILGGSWLIRTSAVRAIDWPDPRLLRHGEDVFLGEAIRQHGWQIANIGTPGVAINTEERRGFG